MRSAARRGAFDPSVMSRFNPREGGTVCSDYVMFGLVALALVVVVIAIIGLGGL